MPWRRMRRQSIGSRILTGYAVIMALAMGFLLIAVSLLIEVDTRQIEAMDRRQRLETNALRLKLSLQQESDGVRGFLLGGEEDYLTPYREAILLHQAALYELDRLVMTPADRRALDRVREDYDIFLSHAEQQIALRRSGASNESIALWQTVGRAGKDTLQQAIDEFVNVHRQSIDAEVTTSQQRRDLIYVLAVLMLILAAISVILSGRRIARSITGPVGELAEVATAFSQGHLDRRATIQTRDELATLAAVMNDMAAKLEQSRHALQQSLRQTEQRNRQLATLNSLAETLSHSLDLRLILQQALDHTLRLTGLEAGWVWLLDEHGLDAEPLVTRAMAPEVLQRLQTAESRRRLLDIARRAVVVNNNEPIAAASTQASAATRYCVGLIPLASRDRTLGIMAVCGPQPRRFDDAERELFQAIGRQVAVGIENARLFAAEQRLTKEAFGLADTARLVSGSLELGEILPIIAQSGVWLLNVDRCMVFLYNVAPRRRHELYHFGFTPEQEALIRAQADQIQKVAQQYTEATACLSIPDAPAETRADLRQVLEWIGARSSLAIALQARGRPLGVLYFDSTHRQRDFSTHDQRVAVALADQASVAIESALLYTGVQERAGQLAGLYEIGKVISATLDRGELYQVLYRETSQLMDADAFFIALSDEAGDLNRVVFSVVHGQRALPQAITTPHGLIGYVARQRQPLLTSQAELERLGVDLQPAGGAVPPMGSILCVPMLREERIIGVMSTQSVQPAAYTEQHLELLVAIANQAAIAVENSQLHQRALGLAVVEERNRLARELHDSVTQMLFSITLTLQAGRVLLRRNVERAEQQMDKAQQTAQEALAEMRALIHQLRPASMNDRGLVAALASYLESYRTRTGLEVSFVHAGSAEFTDAQEQALFRIAQEALNNVVKHAAAHAVEVSLHCGPEVVTLTVQDDGRGLPVDKPARIAPTWGLTGMRERAEILGGTFEIDSTPGGGTTIRVQLPLATDGLVAMRATGEEAEWNR